MGLLDLKDGRAFGPGEVLGQTIDDDRQQHAGGCGQEGPHPAAGDIAHVDDGNDAEQHG